MGYGGVSGRGKAMKRLMMAVLVMSWASPVWGEINFFTGNTLHEECQKVEPDNLYYQANAFCICKAPYLCTIF
jgi:hypothetical protein